MPLFRIILLALACAGDACADTANIIASRDNTLIENSLGTWSGGTMPWLFAGNTNQVDAEDTRRGLVRFSLATIPMGSTISTASLKLRMTKSVVAGTHMFTLHKLLADWGEGSSGGTGGGGSTSTANSATWIHRFYPSIPWQTEGGDFNSTASASLSVAGLNFYTWSSPQLAADVQSWLDNPANNFGWMLRGNEAAAVSAKRFDSRETTFDADKPTLTVSFTPPPVYGACCLGENCVLAAPAQCAALQGVYKGNGSACALGTCCYSDVNASGAVDINDLLEVINNWGPCPAPPAVCPADVVADGAIDIDDLLAVINNWGPCG